MSSRLPSIFPSTPAVIRATGRWTRGWGRAQTGGRRGAPQPAGDASAGRMPWGLCRSECSGHLGLEGAGAGKQGVPRGARLPYWAVTLVSCSSVEAAFERMGPGPQSTPLLPSPLDRRVQRGPRNWESGQRGEGRAQGHPTNQAPGPAPSAPKASSWLPLPIQSGVPGPQRGLTWWHVVAVARLPRGLWLQCGVCLPCTEAGPRAG